MMWKVGYINWKKARELFLREIKQGRSQIIFPQKKKTDGLHKVTWSTVSKCIPGQLFEHQETGHHVHKEPGTQIG